MSISAKERSILAAVELGADQPLTRLRRGLPYREHALRYCLLKLERDEGIRPTPVINFAQLGLTAYALYFSLPAGAAPQNPAVLGALMALPQVKSLLSCAGDFEYQLVFLAENAGDVPRFIDRAGAILRCPMANRHLAILLNESFFGRKYLMPGREAAAPLIVAARPPLPPLDDADRSIIHGLLQGPFQSVRSFARRIGMLPSTLQYRLKKLEGANVIPGWIYPIPSRRLGVQAYRLLISFSVMDTPLRKAFYNFCLRHRMVVRLWHCIGNWDLELTVETPAAEDLLRFRNALYDAFQERIAQTKILTVLGETAGAVGLFAPRGEDNPGAAAGNYC